MTTPDENQTNQPQPNEAGDATKAEEGWDAPEGEPEVQGSNADAADGENGDEGAKAEDGQEGEEKKDADGEGEKPLSAEEHLKNEAKLFRDKHSVSKGEAETLRRLAKMVEDDGLLDRAEIASKLGVDPKYLDAVIDRKELPEPGEDGHIQQLASRFKQDFENPVIQKAIVKAYGAMESQLEMLGAFDFAVANNPELQEKYRNTAPDDVLYFALDEGKAALDDFREVKALGSNPQALLREIRRLRAENAELSKKPEPVVTQETEQQPSQDDLPPPKDAREAKLRLFLQ